MTSHFSPIDFVRLQQALPSWQVDGHAQLGSTNAHASQQAALLSAPAVVITEIQTAGKGRGRNQWWSTGGALTFSLLIRPADYGIPAHEQMLLSLLTAAAVRHVICERQKVTGWRVQLKWPNDLYLDGKKLCGILLEQSTAAPDLLVIGIGLNVNNSFQQAPPELQAKAISLGDVQEPDAPPIDRTEWLVDFLNDFERLLKDQAEREILLAVSWQNFHLLDQQLLTIERAGEKLTGRCEGIDEDGALLLRDAYGLQRIHSAVVLSWEA